MTDEEKKEYEKLKSLLYTGTISQYGKRKLIDMFEKQQKEIERLEARKYMLNAETGEISQIPIDNNYISKDKIKAEIEELKAEIEELKDESKEYQIGFAQGCYEKDLDWKDKIKAKIEEIENEDKKYKNYLKDGRENFTPEYVWVRPVLQSLLEKE